MATASIQGRTQESIRTALGAITADALWLVLVTIGFLGVLRHHPQVVGTLGIVGGALLLWMAWQGVRAARHGIAASSVRGSYRLGLLTVLSSPFSFGWWMASGPLVITSIGWIGIAGLFTSLLVYAVTITYALRWLGARYSGVATMVGYIGAAILAWFGAFFIREGVALIGR